jgi:hypothetical protein
MMENPWIDTRLNKEEMDFLWQIISEENKVDYSRTLAGNISKSELIVDKDNWFFKSALEKLTERMFYRDWDNYCKYHIEKEEPLPKFEMDSLWVNYQKQHEFNPLHFHSGGKGYSFVIFMKIPTYWNLQYALPISANSNSPSASDFQFVWSEKNSEMCTIAKFTLSPEDEGRILFFPASLNHQVYPFYECEEERITISGNIDLYDPNKLKNEQYMVELPKEKILEKLENSIREMKKELKWMKEEWSI